MNTGRYRPLILSTFMIIICLYLLPSFKNAFTLPKELLLYQAAALLACIPLISAAVEGRAVLFLKTGLLPLGLILVLFLVSLAYTPSPRAASGELLMWLSCFVIFLSAAQLTEQHINTVILSSVFAGAAMGAIALLQYFFIDPLPLSGGQYRIYSTLGNPNHVGGYLAIVIPAGLGLLALRGVRSTKLSVAVSIALAVCGAALVAARSRGAMLAAGTGVLIVLAAASRRRAISARGLIAAVLVLSLAVFAFAATVPLRSAKPGKDSAVWRMLAWRGIVKMIAEKPFTGWGAGSLNLVYLDFQADVLDGTEDPGTRASATGILRMAHNEYLQLAAEEGLPAAALFVILIVVCSRAAFKGGTAGPGLGASVVSFAVLSLTGFPLRLAATAYPFFVFAGLCLSFQRTGRKINFRARGTLTRVCLALAAIFILAQTAAYSAKRLAVEDLLTRGIRLYWKNRPGPALGFFEDALERSPHNGVIRFYAGSCLSKMKRYEEAKRAIRESLKTYSEMYSLLELGNLCAVTGESAEAVRILERCARIVPEDPLPHFSLGYAYFRNGDFGAAAEEYRKVLRLDEGYPDARRNLSLAIEALKNREGRNRNGEGSRPQDLSFIRSFSSISV